MSYIVTRKVKKSVYVYEAKSFRNKEGKPRNKQRYLGKLDEDGVLITKKRKLPAKIKEVKTVTKRIIIETAQKIPAQDNSPSRDKNSHSKLLAHSGILSSNTSKDYAVGQCISANSVRAVNTSRNFSGSVKSGNNAPVLTQYLSFSVDLQAAHCVMQRRRQRYAVERCFAYR